MNKLRILMLTTNSGIGGAQRVFHQHAADFTDFAHVEEVVFDRTQDERVYGFGLPLHDLNRVDLWSRFGPLGRLISRAVALKKLVADLKFDVVISHMDGANWVNVLSRSTASKILVVHGSVLHDENVSGLKQWLRMNIIFPWLYNFAASTVAVSEGIVRELRVYGRVRNVRAIPNYFELESIRVQALEPLPPGLETLFAHHQVLVTSGRLAEQKKQSVLLELLAVLRRRGSNARLVILGDGELRESLVRKCSELNLSAWYGWDLDQEINNTYDIYFLGYMPNPYQYLARSTLFLFPSAWEGFPLALCEAMIVGLPVLSADCPTGPREIIAPGTIRDSYDLRSAEFTDRGVLMPLIQTATDVTTWANAIEVLLSEVGLRERIGSEGQQSMAELDRPVVLWHWKCLIEQVILDKNEDSW